jgi:hypothetical protein
LKNHRPEIARKAGFLFLAKKPIFNLEHLQQHLYKSINSLKQQQKTTQNPEINSNSKILSLSDLHQQAGRRKANA